MTTCLRCLYSGAKLAFPNEELRDPPEGLEGDHVIIVDFSYSRLVMEGIISIAATVEVYDHHKTAEKELDGLPNTVFDMGKSGATYREVKWIVTNLMK